MTQISDMVAAKQQAIELAHGQAYVDAGKVYEIAKQKSQVLYNAALANAGASFQQTKNLAALNAANIAAGKAHGERMQIIQTAYNASAKKFDDQRKLALSQLVLFDTMAQKAAADSTQKANLLISTALAKSLRSITAQLPKPVATTVVASSGGIRG